MLANLTSFFLIQVIYRSIINYSEAFHSPVLSEILLACLVNKIKFMTTECCSSSLLILGCFISYCLLPFKNLFATPFTAFGSFLVSCLMTNHHSVPISYFIGSLVELGAIFGFYAFSSTSQSPYQSAPTLWVSSFPLLWAYVFPFPSHQIFSTTIRVESFFLLDQLLNLRLLWLMSPHQCPKSEFLLL